ncbi:hypothetical protein ONS95_010699 [Cadophora gregata]|uniref:uncharacterized protein n=1 Tax=Cadophora gregata TaxID=51156 RepID=UPI0026DD5B49|nr:uncharacterized protein ONS95_010699 [Cadophora gregata]KAK0122467.1 hypothetical protein ONS95_010699 [Cadophora gregata]KAK0127944.1 hypothetical protein ONS96_007442 [Cadophora gregata f. sp. sojae]
MEPYVAEEAEEEARPDANASSVSEQPPPEQLPTQQVPSPRAVPRRDPTLPVRFASPVTGPDDGSTTRRRPFRRTSRDRSPPERKGRDDHTDRGGSPFFGERERQTSSPSPIREFRGEETRRRGRDNPATGARERSPSPIVENARDRRASRAAPDPVKRNSYFNEEDTVYMPSYFERSRNPDGAGRSEYSDDDEEEVDIRRHRGGATNPFSPDYGSRSIPVTRAAPSRGYPDYYDNDEVDVRIRDGRPGVERVQRPRFESPRRTRPERPRVASRYDSDEDVPIRISRRRDSLAMEGEFEYYRPGPPRGELSGADYVGDFAPRTARVGSSYVTPRVYPRERYVEAPRTRLPPPRRLSTLNRDDEDVDTRVERERERTRYTVPEHDPSRPSNNSYATPTIYNRSRYRTSTPPPPPPPTVAPVIINNRIYYDSDDDDRYQRDTQKIRLRSRSGSRSRSRSSGSPPPPSAQPVIINNRIYRDYEDEYTRHDRVDNEYLSLVRSSGHSRSRSRAHNRSKAPSVAPVIINNRITDDYEAENYGTRRWDEPDLGFVSEAYPFSLSRHSKNLHGTESIMSSISDISDVSEKSEQNIQPPPKLKSESGRTYEVLRSRYTGDGVIGGSHAVQLAIAPDTPSTSSKGVAAVFRWVHFEDKTMDFDNFEHNVLNIPGLTEFETAAIAKILGRARRGYDKPLQTSTKAKSRFMVPSFLQDNVSEEKRSVSSKAKAISWLCVPYFCLEKYSAPSGLKTSSHPMRTLLQARFALVQKERDMKQAVCYLQNIPAENCFHIAQVWFIILDDSLVVSCSRLPMNSLHGDFISTLPKAEVQPSLSSPHIHVSTKSSLLWTIPLEECQSWFAFISHFWDYWPLQVEVKLNEKPITASDWPRITKLAEKTTVRLVVDFRPSKKSEAAKGSLLFQAAPTHDAEDASDIPSRGLAGNTPSLHPTDHRRPNNSQSAPSNPSNEEFHVFTWLNSRSGGQNSSRDTSAGNVNFILAGFEEQGLQDDMTEIDNYLTKETSLNHRLIYNRSPESNNRSDIYRRLSELKPDATSTEEHMIARYESSVGILNAAELLYRFFLPSEYEAPTIPKFWGTFARLIKSMPESKPSRPRTTSNRQAKVDKEATELLDWLNQINSSTVPFKDYLSHVPLADRSDIQIPEEFTRAWLHLVLALTAAFEDMRLFDVQMTTCHELIDQGIKIVVSSISKVDISNYAVFPPFEFASLIAFQLSRDENGSTLDISDMYLEYLKTLQSDIEANPLVRSHQDRIVCLKQEIEVIVETLDAQNFVLRQAQRGFRASRIGAREDAEHGDAGFSRRAFQRTVGLTLPADSAGVQSLIIQDNLALVENRIRSFMEMREIASELADWNIQKIDSNKDRQEAAIYAFTIVTIIFLPLGTVAGIMGMNTSDVRDMPFGQWVYWATALPLTILVIALCLAWAGELDNFKEGFANMWRRNPRGYAMIREVYETAGRRERYGYRGVAVKEAKARRSNVLYGGKESYV